jgi:FAD/FMN-containing dehydrogenase
MTVGRADLDRLREGVRGRVLERGEPGYEDARVIFNGMIDRRPVVIVQCAEERDVANAVRFARDRDLVIAVRGGGHNVAGHALCDDGLMIDLSPMRGVDVDPSSRTARAQPGCSWLDFDGAVFAHGFATTGGTVGSTGIAGLTLGGGLGHLMGRYGLTCDNLLSARVVTAAGDVVVAGDDGDRELLWGLRGGGGNFGVVTEFEYRVHPVGPLYGGLVLYPWEAARDALALYREVTLAAPDELGCNFVLLTEPDSGTKLAGISAVFDGPLAEGEAQTAALLTSLPLAGGGLGPITYLDAQAIFAEIPFGLRNYWKGHFLPAMDDETVDFTVEHFASVPSTHTAVLIEAPHGEAARVPNESAAYNQRSARFNASALSIWETADDDGPNIGWARSYAEFLEPKTHGQAVYFNYLGHDEPLERVRAAFGAEKFDRLRALKGRLDPTNAFRLNQNIPPPD